MKKPVGELRGFSLVTGKELMDVRGGLTSCSNPTNAPDANKDARFGDNEVGSPIHNSGSSNNSSSSSSGSKGK